MLLKLIIAGFICLFCNPATGQDGFADFDGEDYSDNFKENMEPGCNQSIALGCQIWADKAKKAYGCNHGKIIPFLAKCIYLYAGDCHEVVYTAYENALINLNESLRSGALCGSNCTDEVQQEIAVNQCKATHLGGQTLNDLADMLHLTQYVPAQCTVLKNVVDCMITEAEGCLALQDTITDDIVHNSNIQRAVIMCGASLPQGAPTFAPEPDKNLEKVPAFQDSIVNPNNDTDTGGGNGNGSTETASSGIPTYVIILLAVAGGMLLVAIVFGIGFCIERRKSEDLLGNEEYGDGQSMASTSAKSYFNPPRYYFGQIR